MKIVADDTIPYLKGILEPYAEVIYLPARQFTNEAVRDADALIVRSIDKCTEKLLAGTKIRLITTATIGYDHIDTAYCDAQGIAWKNAPGCNARSVGEYVLNSLISLSINTGTSLKGKTIGVVGVGHVGAWVAALCSSFGLQVLLNDPPRAEKEDPDEFCTLTELTEKCDIITCHVPLTKEGKYPTYHLANGAFFRSLKREPWFINSSRGGVHDTKALLAAKRAGQVSELILDCWEQEPNIDKELMNVVAIATPHIAGFSADGKANATRICVEHIRDFFSLPIANTEQIRPETPMNESINADAYNTGNRIEQILLSCSNPSKVSDQLKANATLFESVRNQYNYPREFTAYTVMNATKEESRILKDLGFRIN